jgi:hypothetical protein
MIKLAKIKDADAILDFIRTEWKADHIFCRNRDFFLYQYQEDEKLNFIISLSDTNHINGILGFIKSSSNSQSAAWASIWKVSKNNGNSMLGLELMNHLRSMFPGKLMSAGINERTIPLYKYLGIYTGKLKMFVMMNDKLSNFEVAGVNIPFSRKPFSTNKYYSLKLLADKSFSLKNISQYIPQKDELYLSKRYFQHPIYKYQCYGIYNKGALSSILVTRIQSINKHNVLRIVDYIGDEADLKYVAVNIYDMLLKDGFEYVDFLCYGFKTNELFAANFLDVDLTADDLIVPNYFSPFIKKNITINFFADTPNLELLKICKADGDQDRPN